MKKRISVLLSAGLFLLAVSGCGTNTVKVDPVTGSDTVYVRKIAELPEDFIMGMDLSSVISLENSGVVFYDYEGNEADIFKTMAESGITHIRVRVWVDPKDGDGNYYGGGNNDIETAVQIGRRAAKYGLKLIVDFHYSDFWADPGKQMVPKAWHGMNLEDKTEALYQYTKESLKTLKKAGVQIAMVSLGNETNNGLAGEIVWKNIIDSLMKAGSKAVREVVPDALIAVHFTNPENPDSFRSYAKKLDYYGLDYDVFSTSYYPYWHGTLENLSSILSEISETYDKKVMVMETSYANTEEDTDFFGNTIGAGGGVTKNYPYTVQGQTSSVLDVIETMSKTKGGIGVCYWEGAWISVGTNSYEENLKKWEQFGSGWASSYAHTYDPVDAGKYYGGSAVDNQAFFDPQGHPYESLKLFALCRNGNTVELKPDAIEDCEVICDLNGDIILPDVVNAIMNDNSRKELEVRWEAIDEAKMKSSGPAKYEVRGTAGGMEAHCTVSMVEYNFLNNYSFEDDPDKTVIPSGWLMESHKNADQLYVEDKSTDSLTGTRHYHFWSSQTDSIDFDLYQDVTGLKAGTYKFSMSIMGGDCGKTDIYLYVKINGEIVKTAPLSINGYNNWDTGTITDIEYDGTSSFEAGIHVQCQGSGGGAWGKIDDAMLNSVVK